MGWGRNSHHGKKSIMQIHVLDYTFHIAEFKNLGRLDSAHIEPICRIETASLGPTPDMYRNCLGNILVSDIGHETVTLARLDDSDCLGLVLPFILQELGAAVTDLHCGSRC